MTGSNGSSIRLTILDKWYRPKNTWERIRDDEQPLSKKKPVLVEESSFASTPSTIALTLPTAASSITLPPILRITTSTGTNYTALANDPHPSTAYPYGNLPPPDYIPPSAFKAPWPRNGHDRRILKALGEKGLPKAIQRAEKALGKRTDARSIDAWNNRFWEFIARPKPPKPLDRCRIK